MKLAIVSDSLAHQSLPELLRTAKSVGAFGVEFNTGNWSTSPHLSLKSLLESQSEREDFVGLVVEAGLVIAALNCNGNQLHPIDGDHHDGVVRDTIRLSGMLGLKKVCLMSGMPGATPVDKHPNWIVSSWPPENQTALNWQWKERLLPYWRELVEFGKDEGIEQFAVEMHGHQLVYSPRTLKALRDNIGPAVCANLDPSHLMWMGADPLVAIDYLGDAIAHVHGKDTFVNVPVAAVASMLENGPLDNVSKRAWSHCTLGFGHDQKWWNDFCYRLRMVGFDGWISVEHEDMNLSRIEGLRKAFDVLQIAALTEAPDYDVQSI